MWRPVSSGYPRRGQRWFDRVLAGVGSRDEISLPSQIGRNMKNEHHSGSWADPRHRANETTRCPSSRASCVVGDARSPGCRLPGDLGPLVEFGPRAQMNPHESGEYRATNAESGPVASVRMPKNCNLKGGTYAKQPSRADPAARSANGNLGEPRFRKWSHAPLKF